MPALPGCIISDTYAVLSPSGAMAGVAGSITARASAAPLFVQQQGGTWLAHANTVVSAVDQAGAWTLVLPSQPNCDPPSVTWTISLPDGMAWTGPVSAAMVTASQSRALTLHDLKATWGWAVARSSAVVALAPYVATSTALGMVTLDQNPAAGSGYPVALTAPRVGAAGGVAGLDGAGHVPLAQLGGLTTSQLSSSAGILGSQLSSSAGIVAGQIAAVSAAALQGTHTLPDGVLSANVPLLTTANTFTAAQTISAPLTVAGALTCAGSNVAQQGTLANRPSAPVSAPGAAALYWSTDQGAADIWDGTGWQAVRGGATIKRESWDTVVAPAIPLGWHTTSALVTATTTSPSSAPNALLCPAATAHGTVQTALWTTRDGNQGDVRVSATVRFADIMGSDTEAWVAARVTTDAAWAVQAHYGAGLVANSGTLSVYVQKSVAGATTNLGSVRLPGAAGATTYRLILSCVASHIQAQVQRLSDSLWVSPAGSWVADPSGTTVALSYTDTDVTGSGVAGLLFWTAPSGAGDLSVDDWLLERAGVATLDGYGYVPLAQLSASAGVSVKSYGATGDGVSDDTAAIAAAVAALGSSAGVLFFPPGTYVTGPQTFGPAITVRMQRGALLQHGASTLSISGTLDAGPSQIFSGTGTVSLAQGAAERIYAEWWGAGAGGSADDVAINAALLCAAGGGTPSCGLVQLLAKTYHTSATITMQPGVTLAGMGSSVAAYVPATEIQCSSVSVPVLTLPTSGPMVLRDFDTSGGVNSIYSGNSILVFLSRLALSSAAGVGLLVNGGCERWFVDHVSITGAGSHGVWFQHDAGNANYLDKSHFLFLQVNRPGGNGIRIECRGFNNTFENVNITQSLQHAWYLDNTFYDLLILNPNHEATGWSPNTTWCYTTGSIAAGSSALTVASTANLSVGDTVTVVGAAGVAGQALSATVTAISGLVVTLSAAAGASVSGGYVTNALYDEFYCPGVLGGVSYMTIVNAAVGGLDSGAWANGVRFILNAWGAGGILINMTALSGAPLYDPYGSFSLVGGNVATGKRPFANGQAGVLGQSQDDDLWINVKSGYSAQVRLQSDSALGYGNFVLSKSPRNAVDSTPRPTLFEVVGGDGTLLATRSAPLNGVYTIPAGTTLPDVSQSDILITANSAATTISGFSNAAYAGQDITLIFNDAHTTVQHGSAIFLAAGASFTGAVHQALKLVYTGSVWVEPGGSA